MIVLWRKENYGLRNLNYVGTLMVHAAVDI